MMPDLFYQPYDFIDRHRLTFNDALTHKETNIVIKARVKAWITDFEKKASPAFHVLGLDKKPLPGYYSKMIEETEKANKKEKQKKKEKDIAQVKNNSSESQQQAGELSYTN